MEKTPLKKQVYPKIMEIKNYQKELFTTEDSNLTNYFKVFVHLPVFIPNNLEYREITLNNIRAIIKLKSPSNTLPTTRTYFIFKILVKKLIKQIKDNESTTIETSLGEIQKLSKYWKKTLSKQKIHEEIQTLSETNFTIKLTDKKGSWETIHNFNIIDNFTINSYKWNKTFKINLSNYIEEKINEEKYIQNIEEIGFKYSYGAERIYYYLLEYYYYADIKPLAKSYQKTFYKNIKELKNFIGLKNQKESNNINLIKKYLNELKDNEIISFYSIFEKENEKILLIKPSQKLIDIIKKGNYFKQFYNNKEKFITYKSL